MFKSLIVILFQLYLPSLRVKLPPAHLSTTRRRLHPVPFNAEHLEAVNTNTFSVWVDLVGNQTRACHFSSRRSMHLTNLYRSVDFGWAAATKAVHFHSSATSLKQLWLFSLSSPVLDARLSFSLFFVFLLCWCMDGLFASRVFIFGFLRKKEYSSARKCGQNLWGRVISFVTMLPVASSIVQPTHVVTGCKSFVKLV